MSKRDRSKAIRHALSRFEREISYEARWYVDNLGDSETKGERDYMEKSAEVYSAIAEATQPVIDRYKGELSGDAPSGT